MVSNDAKFGILLQVDVEDYLVVDHRGVAKIEGVMLADALLPETVYLTSLKQNEMHFLPGNLGDKKLLSESFLLVKFFPLCVELGWPQSIATNEVVIDKDIVNILMSVRQGYVSALNRAGIDVSTLDPDTPKMFSDAIYSKTMPKKHRGSSWPDIGIQDRDSGIHAWVRTGFQVPDGHSLRTLSVDRLRFYSSLLSIPMPCGQWSQGDPAASQRIILDNMTDNEGVLVQGHHEAGDPGSFISCCTTIEPREMYTAHEVVGAQEERGYIRIKNWWSGPLERIEYPLKDDMQEGSLGDGILIEMVHRSWRKHHEKGYWLACAERLMLHGIAEALQASGVNIYGYGSGRITITSPKVKSEADDQDSKITQFVSPLAIQMPINLSWDINDLKWRLPFLSQTQIYSKAGDETLVKLDKAIDEGDEESFKVAHESAYSVIQNLFS